MRNFQKFGQERTLLISSLRWLIVNLTESRFTWKMIVWRRLWGWGVSWEEQPTAGGAIPWLGSWTKVQKKNWAEQHHPLLPDCGFFLTSCLYFLLPWLACCLRASVLFCSQWPREGVYFSLCFRMTVHHWGKSGPELKQGRNLEARTAAESMGELCLLCLGPHGC